jgi:hypothetical protein
MRQSSLSLSLSLSPQPKKITVFGNLMVCFLKESRLQTGRYPCPGISRICNKESVTEIQKKNEKCNQKQTTERQSERQRADLPLLKLLPQWHKAYWTCSCKRSSQGRGIAYPANRESKKTILQSCNTRWWRRDPWKRKKNELKKMRWREREEQNWGLPPTNSGSVGSILGKEMEHEADSAMAERIVLARQHPLQLCCFDRSVLVHVRPAECCDDFWICIRGKQGSLWRRIHLWWPRWSASKWGLSVRGGSSSSSSSSSLLLSIKSWWWCYCLVKFWRCWCWCWCWCSWVVAVQPVRTLLLLIW